MLPLESSSLYHGNDNHSIDNCPAISEDVDTIRTNMDFELTAFDVQKSTLIFDAAKFQKFPINNQNDFRMLRNSPNLVYFDRTQYISILENIQDTLLFLRPRRFGKSLTVSMLAYFHGVQYKKHYNSLFKVRSGHFSIYPLEDSSFVMLLLSLTHTILLL